MARQKTVFVTFGAENARYVIGEDNEVNGPIMTFGDAIDRFTNGSGLADGLVANSNGEEADYFAALRDGDVVIIATEQSSKSGYEGG